MDENDLKRLSNMLESAKFAVASIQDRKRGDLDDDRQLTLSLVKSLEMIGQASSRVSKECHASCEPIPWEDVISMKHQVYHTYWEIDRDWVWEKVSRDLPVLIEALETLLCTTPTCE